jgi:hypothetical protein
LAMNRRKSSSPNVSAQSNDQSSLRAIYVTKGAMRMSWLFDCSGCPKLFALPCGNPSCEPSGSNDDVMIAVGDGGSRRRLRRKYRSYHSDSDEQRRPLSNSQVTMAILMDLMGIEGGRSFRPEVAMKMVEGWPRLCGDDRL